MKTMIVQVLYSTITAHSHTSLSIPSAELDEEQNKLKKQLEMLEM